MGTLNAFYVKSNADSIASVVRTKFSTAEIERGAEFCGVTLANDAFTPPIDDLAELSSQLDTDVIWLSFQSAVDAFQYYHWRGGTMLRSLVFGCFKQERTWERVEGTQESWEREAFFDPTVLEDLVESAQSDADRHELQRIWREAELLAGRTEPNVDSRESARKVAEHYRLPGWD